MRRFRVLPVLLILLLAAFAATADPDPTSEPTKVPTVEDTKAGSGTAGRTQILPVAGTTLPRSAPSPMVAEIKQLLADQKLQVAELQGELQRAADGEHRIELLQQIHDLKVTTEVDILRVQLRYAVAEGRSETAAKIEDAIDTLTHPRTTPAPEPRPRPIDGQR